MRTASDEAATVGHLQTDHFEANAGLTMKKTQIRNCQVALPVPVRPCLQIPQAYQPRGLLNGSFD